MKSMCWICKFSWLEFW